MARLVTRVLASMDVQTRFVLLYVTALWAALGGAQGQKTGCHGGQKQPGPCNGDGRGLCQHSTPGPRCALWHALGPVHVV